MKRLGLIGLGLVSCVQATTYDYVADSQSGYDATGKPLNMTNINSQLPSNFLNNVYGMLPESTEVNPAYVAADTKSNIAFDDDAATHATATVTFLNEGAGYRNSLGYFVYDTANPPATKDDIAAHTIIFPNASKPSAGTMSQGDTVELGIQLFSGQSLGFFVVPNGWGYGGSGSTIQSDGPWGQPFYSLAHLNPEPASIRRHNVVFVDPANELLVIGFDDQYISQGDKDYNDILFTVKISPFYAIDGVNPDGSIDSGYIPLEEETQSRTSTTTSYYPSQNGFATLMFEDNWPKKGDYDFNDLVVRYRLKRTLNSQSDLLRLEGTYQVQAKGASFHNGFALRLPGVAASSIGSAALTRNGSPVSHQVVESPTGEAVLIISPDISVDVTSSCEMFRTLVNCTESINTEFQLDVTMSTPAPVSTVGLPPYDPFIFAVDSLYHGDIFGSPPGRQWELHLKQFSGTSLFNNGFFGMADDSSGGSNFFVSGNKMPWAINITEQWDHPAEYQDISHAYPDFAKWVEADGFSNTDWYLRSKAVVDKLYE